MFRYSWSRRFPCYSVVTERSAAMNARVSESPSPRPHLTCPKCKCIKCICHKDKTAALRHNEGGESPEHKKNTKDTPPGPHKDKKDKTDKETKKTEQDYLERAEPRADNFRDKTAKERQKKSKKEKKKSQNDHERAEPSAAKPPDQKAIEPPNQKAIEEPKEKEKKEHNVLERVERRADQSPDKKAEQNNLERAEPRAENSPCGRLRSRQARECSAGRRRRGRSRQGRQHFADRSPHRRSKEARQQSAVAETAAASSSGKPSAPVASARRRSHSASLKRRRSLSTSRKRERAPSASGEMPRAFSPAHEQAVDSALQRQKRKASSPEASEAKDLARPGKETRSESERAPLQETAEGPLALKPRPGAAASAASAVAEEAVDYEYYYSYGYDSYSDYSDSPTGCDLAEPAPAPPWHSMPGQPWTYWQACGSQYQDPSSWGWQEPASDSRAWQTYEPEPAVAEGVGSIACLYVYVDKEANIDEVAKDLRNQAPTVLFVGCFDSETALRMQTALSKDAVNKTRDEGGKGAVNKTRGDGGKGKGQQARAGKEDFQVMFKCVRQGELIIAGRHGIVKEVEIKQVLCTPGGGPLLIAEVDFSVAIQQILSLRVAALIVYGQDAAGDAKAWGEVAQALEHRSVRLIAGEFRDRIFTILQLLRTRLAVRACAVEPSTDKQNGTRWLASSSMLFVGPVGHIKSLATRDGGDWPVMLETRGSGVRIKEPVQKTWRELHDILCVQAFDGKDEEDQSRGWPIIERVIEKKAMTVWPHTKKMSIFLGCRNSRRQPDSIAYRADRRAQRANKWYNRAWAQPYWRSAKGHGKDRHT